MIVVGRILGVFTLNDTQRAKPAIATRTSRTLSALRGLLQLAAGKQNYFEVDKCVHTLHVDIASSGRECRHLCHKRVVAGRRNG